MRARPQLLPLPLRNVYEAPLSAASILYNDLPLGSSAPIRDSVSNAVDSVYNGALTPTTIASGSMITDKPIDNIIFRNPASNVGQDVNCNDNEPNVRRKSPPRTLKLPPSLSLPHLCATSARTLSSLGSITPNAYAASYSQDTVERSSISKILDYLYVGDVNDAASAEIIEAHKIQRVINVSNINVCAPQILRDEKHFLRISVHDSGNARLLPLFDDTYKFIEAGRCEKDNVLVHCMAGISRSPTIAIAYIMRSQRIGFEEARKIVKLKRPCISPNINFMGQLVAYEWALRLQNILPPLIERHPYSGVSTLKNDTENLTERESTDLSRKSLLPSIAEKIVKSTEETTACQILPPSRRPTCLKGLSMRNSSSSINKSYSSDFIATALRSATSASSSSSTTTIFPSSSSSTTSSSTYSLSIHSTTSSVLHNSITMESSSSSSYFSNTCTTYINENDNRIMSPCSIRQQRPASMPSMVTIDNPSSSSQEYVTIPTAVADLLNIKYRQDNIPSPSTEFSKLDISLINPCFKRDTINTRKPVSCSGDHDSGGGRRFSTSTDISESASSGIFTETSYDDREDDRSSIGVFEDEMSETRLSRNNSTEMFTNPVFELTNKNWKIKPEVDCFSEITKDKAVVDKMNMNLSNKSKDFIASDRTHAGKSFLQGVIRKNRISNNCSNEFTSNFAESHEKFNCYCRLNGDANTKKIALTPTRVPCSSVNRLRTILTHCRARPMCLSRSSCSSGPSRLPLLEDNEDAIDGVKQLSPSTSTSANLTMSECDHVTLNAIDSTTDVGYSDKGYDVSLQENNVNQILRLNKSNDNEADNILTDDHLLINSNIDKNEDMHPTRKKRRIKRVKLQKEHKESFTEEMDSSHMSTDNINSTTSHLNPPVSNFIIEFPSSTSSTREYSVQKTKSGLYPVLQEDQIQQTPDDCIESIATFKEPSGSSLYPDLYTGKNNNNIFMTTTKIHSVEKIRPFESPRSTMTTIPIGRTKTMSSVKRTSSMSKQIRKRSTKALINEDATASDTELDVVRCDPDLASIGSASSQEIFANYCYVI